MSEVMSAADEGWQQLETWVAKLAEHRFTLPLVALYQGEAICSNYSNWLHFVDQEADSYSVSFVGKDNNVAGGQLEDARFLDRIIAGGSEQLLFSSLLTENAGGPITAGGLFALFAAQHPASAVGHVVVGGQLSANNSSMTASSNLFRVCPQHIQLVLRFHAADRSELKIRRPILVAWDAVAAHVIRINGMSTAGRLSRLGERFVITLIEESRMNNEGKIPVALSLGQLELSLEQALRLRPGQSLVFDLPRPLQAAIKIGSTDWAVGELEVDDQGVKITICSMVTG